MPAKEVNVDVLPRMHLLTAVPALDRSFLDRVVEVAGTSADAIQVRAKDAADRDLAAWTRALVAAVSPSGIKVIVNDRVDVALVAGADGVHLGREDLPVAAVRSLAGEGFLIGATCRGPEGVRRAVADGADYCGVGPVFTTTTKAGLPEPLGLEGLRAAAACGPAVAIGGITPARVPDVMACGAHGVAVVAAIWGSTDPPRATRQIARLVHAA